uniref:Glycine cleavage system H protein, mitochondrial n=1 Tax=Stylophora pistillata TaxID=50429 RepID=A0A2B4RJ14_STYPI
MSIPENLKYTKEHEWVRVAGDEIVIGITDFAQGELGDIVYVDVSTEGENLEADEVFGSVEAVKTVSDLCTPIAGAVTAFNKKLENEPEAINANAYDAWVIKMKPVNIADVENLLDAAAYKKLIGTKADMISDTTIVALATPQGNGAIGVIRISGGDALEIATKVFFPHKAKNLQTLPTHRVVLGDFKDGTQTIDELLCTVFKNPHSYTGEDVVEFSCHGSPYIQERIIKTLLKNGCRSAKEGEFTLRAFLNGKMDLTQAEAVADLIACESAEAHEIALNQMRGGITGQLAKLRKNLLDFTALIELELDFAEEDVNFADRSAFSKLLTEIKETLQNLIDSFQYGNALKNGIPVAIVGAPNTGKSTLLNTLSNEEKAIVSDIEGTTRDAIENECIIEGVVFRFIDTAGIRNTADLVENIGIQKTYEKIEKAQQILLMIPADAHFENPENTEKELKSLLEKTGVAREKITVVIGKIDLAPKTHTLPKSYLGISAKNQTGIAPLKKHLVGLVKKGRLSNSEIIISNARHYEALTAALTAIESVIESIERGVPSDLFAIDIRQALREIGNITGEIDVDKDVLGHIFSNFCVGK